MKKITYEVDQISKTAWSALLLGFADATIDQSYAYAESRWQQASLSHLIVKCNTDVIAAAQVVIQNVPFLSSGVAHIKFGPLWQPFNQSANTEHLKQILGFLREEYVVKRGLFLRLMPPPLKGGTDFYCDLLASAGYKKSEIEDKGRYCVDLSVPIDELRKNLKNRWRNHLNRTEKHRLVCRQQAGDEAIKLFLSLYQTMLSRKKFTDTSAIVDFPEIYANLELRLKPKIYMVYQGDTAVAGAIVSGLGDTAHYLFGATDSLGLQLDAGYFLQWEVIKDLYNQGVMYYDLGGAVGSSGLQQFKSGLVGKYPINATLPGEFDACENCVSHIAAIAGFKLRGLRAAWPALLT